LRLQIPYVLSAFLTLFWPAGDAIAAPFTIAEPLPIVLSSPSPGPSDARATILPDDTFVGDFVCLDPVVSCMDVDLLVFRVSVSESSLMDISLSAAVTSISGIGYFIGGGLAPPTGGEPPPPRGSPVMYLQPGEVSESLFAAFEAGTLSAGQNALFTTNLLGWLPVDSNGSLVQIPEPGTALLVIAGLAGLAARRRPRGTDGASREPRDRVSR
jgi:hypothetical protein